MSSRGSAGTKEGSGFRELEDEGGALSRAAGTPQGA